MARIDRILDKYKLSAMDRRIAADLAERYGGDPRFADRFEALVGEYAQCMGRVEAGEITPEDVAAHMAGLAEMIGTPPDLLMNLQNHFDREMPAEFAATGETEQEAEAEAEAEQPEPAQQRPAAQQPPVQPAQAQPAPASLAAPVQPAGPTRDELQAVITRGGSAMRSEPGSPEWLWYWKEGGSAQYLRSLQGIEALDASPPQPATIAGGTDAPAPPEV